MLYRYKMIKICIQTTYIWPWNLHKPKTLWDMTLWLSSCKCPISFCDPCPCGHQVAKPVSRLMYCVALCRPFISFHESTRALKHTLHISGLLRKARRNSLAMALSRATSGSPRGLANEWLPRLKLSRRKHDRNQQETHATSCNSFPRQLLKWVWIPESCSPSGRRIQKRKSNVQISKLRRERLCLRQRDWWQDQSLMGRNMQETLGFLFASPTPVKWKLKSTSKIAWQSQSPRIRVTRHHFQPWDTRLRHRQTPKPEDLRTQGKRSQTFKFTHMSTHL